MDAFRDDQDIGLRTMDWRSSRALLPGLIGHMGQGGRFVVLAAEPTRFSAIGYRQMLPKEGCRLGGAC